MDYNFLRCPEFVDKNENNMDYNFLSCLEFVDKNENIKLYRFLESLVFKELPEQKCRKFSKELQELGPFKFIQNLRAIIGKNPDFTFAKKKRQIITYSMIEDYVIRHNKTFHDFQDLKLKIFLKKISAKNIIVENDEIINIKYP